VKVIICHVPVKYVISSQLLIPIIVRFGSYLQTISNFKTQRKISESLVTIEEMVKNFPEIRIQSVLQIIAATECNSEAMKMLVPAVIQEEVWEIRNLDQLKALAEIITQKEPAEIDIRTEKRLSTDDVNNLCHLLSVMRESFSGRLWLKLEHSCDCYEPLDERIVAELKNTK